MKVAVPKLLIAPPPPPPPVLLKKVLFLNVIVVSLSMAPPPGPVFPTNVLEYTAGTANGSYTNNFVSTGQTNILGGGTGFGVVTNMLDAGGATNVPSRYYRVRVLLP